MRSFSMVLLFLVAGTQKGILKKIKKSCYRQKKLKESVEAPSADGQAD